jgi:two-component system, NtrC family, sensor histidine kinase HydH
VENWYRIQAALIAAVICTALASHVMLKGWRLPVFRRFAWFNLNLVAWFLVDALVLTEALGPRLGQGARGIVASLIPATSLGFFSGFARDEESGASGRLRHAAMGLSFLLFAMTVASWPGTPAIRQWVLFGAVTISLIVALAQMGFRYRSLVSRVERVRLKYVTIAGAGVFALLVLEYVPGLQVTSAGNVLTALYMFFMFQVVTRRRLIDIFEFLGRFVSLGGLSLVLGTIYVLLVGWWRHDFGLFVFNTAIASVVILILFEPLSALVQERLTQLVFREKFEFTAQAEALRADLTKVIDVPTLSNNVLQHLEASRRVTHASMYLFDEDGLTYTCLGSIGTGVTERLDAITSRPFLDRLLEQKVLAIENLEAESEALSKQGAVEDQGGGEVLEAVQGTMRELHSALSIGFVSGDQLLGMLNVQDERLREAYGSDEIKALVALAAQATITIENSRLFDRIRERDRLAALGEMAAGLAHEIRNPLGAIKGAAQLLNEVDSERDTYLEIITEEVNRLNSVVGQFLTYARPLKSSGELVDVNHVLERTLTLVNVEEHGCQIELIQAPNLPSTRTDPELLRQVALNLSRNAIEAMGEQGGRLTITTSITRRRPPRPSDGGKRGDHVTYIRVRFEDEGPGIPDEVLERLFIPFYTTKPSGTGLGLAICDRIIRSMGGWIDVASYDGDGAAFTLYLPVFEQSRSSVTST